MSGDIRPTPKTIIVEYQRRIEAAESLPSEEYRRCCDEVHDWFIGQMNSQVNDSTAYYVLMAFGWGFTAGASHGLKRADHNFMAGVFTD